MNSHDILKADVLDILFDNRNKQYGAYTLRKYYNNRISISLGISLSLTLLLFFLFRPDRLDKTVAKDPGMVTVSEFMLPQTEIKKTEPVVLPKRVKPAVTKIAADKFTTLVIKENPNDHLATNEDLMSRLISNEKLSGKEIPFVSMPDEIKHPSGNGESKEKTETAVQPLPSREPEFPGGKEAWFNFLNKYLRVPGDLQAGEKKTVMIRFQVSEEGEVNGFSVVQSAGSEYDNEVIRVLKKMPRWKPAIQNGEAVARSFTQPVSFIGLEE